MTARGVAILGSTGSIGRTTLEVMAAFPDRFRAVALTANRRSELLSEQVAEYGPELAVLVDGDPAEMPASGTRLATGWDGVLEAAAHPDAEIVVNALVGAAGLEPSLVALTAGKRLALANKESLVVGGPLVMRAAAEHGGALLPIDSEHSAILQCLQGADARAELLRIVLTASGGPFRGRTRGELVHVTPSEALRHPTWEMGAKITVDSATLVNKALEVIEAHHLFGLPYDRIDVVVHPQSIVHSLVEFRDGSVLAQLGHPTMALPILYALSHPDRLPYEPKRLDLAQIGSLTFEPVPDDRFPAFEAGRRAGRLGGTAPAAFNAANEEAVAAFLDGRLPFVEIAEVIERVLDSHDPEDVTELAVVRRADERAREAARSAVRRLTAETTRRSS
jgi:1-deoxy-D-xylulose-5-phosphate reductoisomerase